MYFLIICCLIGGGILGPCVGVCRTSKYKYDMVLVVYSVCCSMEDVSNNTALSFDVVSIVLSVCVICFCVGGWFQFEDFGWYAA